MAFRASAPRIFTRLFQEYGLPKRIRGDNRVPFATNKLARLSTLSTWWVRLGIPPERIEPGHPEQNGRRERMHRTLEAETTRPAAGSLAAQQRLHHWASLVPMSLDWFVTDVPDRSCQSTS